MLLGVIPLFSFGILRIFGGNHKREENWKSGHYRAPTPQRREPTPQRRPMPRHGIPSPQRGRGAKNGTPRVRRGVAKLHRGEGLRRSVVVLCCGVDIVHNEQFSDFCFRTPRIRTPIF